MVYEVTDLVGCEHTCALFLNVLGSFLIVQSHLKLFEYYSVAFEIVLPVIDGVIYEGRDLHVREMEHPLVRLLVLPINKTHIDLFLL